MEKKLFFRGMIAAIAPMSGFLCGMEQNPIVEYAALIRPFSMGRALTAEIVGEAKKSGGAKNRRTRTTSGTYNSDKFKFIKDQIKPDDIVAWYDVYKFKDNAANHLGRYYFSNESEISITIKDRKRIVTIFHNNTEFENFCRQKMVQIERSSSSSQSADEEASTSRSRGSDAVTGSKSDGDSVEALFFGKIDL